MFMRDLLGEKARDIFRSKGVLCIKVRRDSPGCAACGGLPHLPPPQPSSACSAGQGSSTPPNCRSVTHSVPPLCTSVSPAGPGGHQVCVPGCARDDLLWPCRHWLVDGRGAAQPDCLHRPRPQPPGKSWRDALRGLPLACRCGWERPSGASGGTHLAHLALRPSQPNLPLTPPLPPLPLSQELAEGLRSCVWTPLPEGWTEHHDAHTNRPYYVNSATGAKQWERPETACALVQSTETSHKQPKGMQPRKNGSEAAEATAVQA